MLLFQKNCGNIEKKSFRNHRARSKEKWKILSQLPKSDLRKQIWKSGSFITTTRKKRPLSRSRCYIVLSNLILEKFFLHNFDEKSFFCKIACNNEKRFEKKRSLRIKIALKSAFYKKTFFIYYLIFRIHWFHYVNKRKCSCKIFCAKNVKK